MQSRVLRPFRHRQQDCRLLRVGISCPSVILSSTEQSSSGGTDHEEFFASFWRCAARRRFSAWDGKRLRNEGEGDPINGQSLLAAPQSLLPDLKSHSLALPLSGKSDSGGDPFVSSYGNAIPIPGPGIDQPVPAWADRRHALSLDALKSARILGRRSDRRPLSLHERLNALLRAVARNRVRKVVSVLFSQQGHAERSDVRPELILELLDRVFEIRARGGNLRLDEEHAFFKIAANIAHTAPALLKKALASILPFFLTKAAVAPLPFSTGKKRRRISGSMDT